MGKGAENNPTLPCSVFTVTNLLCFMGSFEEIVDGTVSAGGFSHTGDAAMGHKSLRGTGLAGACN